MFGVDGDVWWAPRLLRPCTRSTWPRTHWWRPQRLEKRRRNWGSTPRGRGAGKGGLPLPGPRAHCRARYPPRLDPPKRPPQASSLPAKAARPPCGTSAAAPPRIDAARPGGKAVWPPAAPPRAGTGGAGFIGSWLSSREATPSTPPSGTQETRRRRGCCSSWSPARPNGCGYSMPPPSRR
ncbi:hypothetical protein PVAP13_8NG344800 [Panicum virgatum]|uniref:Uncharacterized protein n=1 Tax=Panicum virgatum TaxID=38727 RepID=A0A8T0P928_PANVG|nr:hypothetical protein PVAP13_8NG344800 [Panicum virgatum]